MRARSMQREHAEHAPGSGAAPSANPGIEQPNTTASWSLADAKLNGAADDDADDAVTVMVRVRLQGVGERTVCLRGGCVVGCQQKGISR